MAFLVGVALGTFFVVPNLVSWMAVFCLPFMFFIGRKVHRFWWYIILAVLFGICRVLISFHDFDSQDIAAFVHMQGNVEIQGRIVADPEVVQGVMKLMVEVKNFRSGSWQTDVRGKILVRLPPFFQVQWGDKLQLWGKLRAPENTDTFAYAGFLAQQDVFVIMKAQGLKKIPSEENFLDQSIVTFWRSLWGFRRMLFQQINELFPEPTAGIMAGLLLGIRSSIPQSILEDFNHTGLSHILAISGFNISLLIQIFANFFKNFSRKKRFWFTFIGIVFFTLLTGFSPSVLRAAFMGSLVVFAGFMGRKPQVLLSLCMSGAIMVFITPLMLSFDLSFQLSFFATLGLVLVIDHLEKYIKNLPSFIRDNLGVTLAAQVFTLPILLNSFGRFSIISPLANVIVLPWIPLLMLLGFLALILSFIYFPLGQLVAAFAWVCSILMLGLVHLIAKIPFASLEVQGVPLWIFIIYLVGVVFILFRKSKLGRSYFPGPSPP